MSFFKPRVSFPLNFTSPFSVMAHNSHEIFQLKHYMLCTKRAHQRTIFQTFECADERSPKSSCYFWNHKVRISTHFASLFSFMKDNSSLLLQLKPSTKRTHQKEIFRLLGGWSKIHQIPHVIFETTSQFFLFFFFNFASLFSVMRDFRLQTAHVKFHPIFTLIDFFC